MQLNIEKTKIMVFFETPALLRARGGQHQPSPTMLPFHVYSPFPTSDPLSHPILEVSQFGDNVSGILDMGAQENNSTQSGRFVYGGTISLT